MSTKTTTESRPALDTSATYGVDDGMGNAITDGLSAHDAYRTAQRIADERAETVYLYDSRPLTDEEIEDAAERTTIAIVPTTERLTDDMLSALCNEAAAAGDDRLLAACETCCTRATTTTSASARWSARRSTPPAPGTTAAPSYASSRSEPGPGRLLKLRAKVLAFFDP